jgi:Flp pilus assembly protein TadG
VRDHFHAREKAQAFVELALVLVALLSLAITAFDYGQVVNIYLVTIHATREAARVASVAGTAVSAVQAAAQNAAGDSIAPTNLTVTCQLQTFDGSHGTYTATGPCASTLTVDQAFVITSTTTVSPVLPFTGLLFGSTSVGPISVSYSLLGIAQPNS